MWVGLYLLIFDHDLIQQVPYHEVLAASNHKLPLLDWYFFTNFYKSATILAHCHPNISYDKAFKVLIISH